MAIDWQADLDKKVANLLRKFVAEVEAHGDGDVIGDEWRVDINVFKSPKNRPPQVDGKETPPQTPPHGNGEGLQGNKTEKKK